MKFIADVMLGRLAKRLRLLGFDVLYDRTLDDNELIRISLAQDRVILTRDVALAARPLAAHHVLIASDDVREQIEQIFAAFPLAEQLHPLTRCSTCNEPLSAASREEIRDLVPRHVYDTYNDFLKCTGCGRIYWRGTHVARMRSEGRVKWEKQRP